MDYNAKNVATILNQGDGPNLLVVEEVWEMSTLYFS